MVDLKSRGWIITKGILFVVIVLLSGAGVVIHDDRLVRLGLLVVCVWAACRFYYFLFYALERYVGVEGCVAAVGAPFLPAFGPTEEAVGADQPVDEIAERMADRGGPGSLLVALGVGQAQAFAGELPSRHVNLPVGQPEDGIDGDAECGAHGQPQRALQAHRQGQEGFRNGRVSGRRRRFGHVARTLAA